MKKIPTMFERDWHGDRSRVLPTVHPGCEWALAGQGVATRKLDGTCCLIEGGKLFKRREVGYRDKAPEGFRVADVDEATGKTVGWVPVGDGPEDRWHREAFAWLEEASTRLGGACVADGTYEMIGPKVQGNPERSAAHILVTHDGLREAPGSFILPAPVPTDFDGLREYLRAHDIEGIVWHHPDGRMAKIKGRDFGIKRSAIRKATEG